MFLALVMVMLFYIVLLYVLVYEQLLVLVIQPCCSSSLSDVHVPNLYLHIDEQIKKE